MLKGHLLSVWFLCPDNAENGLKMYMINRKFCVYLPLTVDDMTQMNFEGIIVGLATFLIIGIFHPIVIKAEYHFSSRCWPVFLAAGSLCCAASLFAESPLLSVALGSLGCTCLWCIIELKEQERRVARGWFPENPKRRAKRDGE